MIEDLIGTLVRGDLGVRNFDADVNIFLLGITLHAVQYGYCIIGAFFPRHTPPFAWDGDQNGASNAYAGVDPGVRGVFDLVVDFLADQTILETGSGTDHQGRRQAILLQDRHLLDGGQIYAFETDAREDLAPLLERSGRACPNRPHHALLQAPARSSWSLRGQHTGSASDQGHSHTRYECSSFHGREYITLSDNQSRYFAVLNTTRPPTMVMVG